MSKKTAWDIVMLARDSQRPKAKDYIESIVDDFIEFHGDRAFGAVSYTHLTLPTT